MGDALGAPVEFKPRHAILAEFGPSGLQSLAPWRNEAGIMLPAGSITDDTQMSMATAAGLLEWASRHERSRGFQPADDVWPFYVRWLASQSQPAQRRYPGSTCVSAIREGRGGDTFDPINDRKGSGGIMRVAPVGLAFPPETAFDQAAEVAALTHGHPSGFLAAGFFAGVISRLVRGPGGGARSWHLERGGVMGGAVAEMREVLLGYDDYDEVLDKVDEAVELYMADADLDIAFETLGEGWIAEEALGIALFCALNFPDDFAEGVLAAVNITGDSDTTGCLTGALLGAELGELSIPAEWRMRVEGADDIERVADTMLEAFVDTPAR